MFTGVPATVEWVVEKAGLQLYSAGITPAKGGPLLHLGANYPHSRQDLEPLTQEESAQMIKWVLVSLQKKGYKAQMSSFSHKKLHDHNDFRIKVLLKEKEVDADHYKSICNLWKERKKASAQYSEVEVPVDVSSAPLGKML